MIFESESAQNFLQEEFSRRVRANHRYSMRAFARSLGLSSGELSEILRKQRPISLKVATKISKAMSFNSIETIKFFELVDAEKRNSFIEDTAENYVKASTQEQKKLDEDTFHLVSEWQHFAILNLLDCVDFRWDSSYVAKRLGLSQAQAQLAMNLLVRLNLVYKKGNIYQGVKDIVLSPSGVTSSAVRKYHRQIMEKAIEAIELQKINERELSGVGFAVDTSHLLQIKKEISAFQDQLVAKYSKGKKQEVYFLEIALFKLTQGVSNEKD